ncbi:hypothetical protein EX30DRAFT_361007 [Ascodesmis nigricans]|uniref:Mediator of RNA polymerase II transcription subunit 11 n=1 Tax=Ascodesmis nigricans TaxID=341454 RepID=A0A4S2N714_9PEZI|nr:hypothetical protein EX30DRAFT_361007 [Ascodesmis nigricans]
MSTPPAPSATGPPPTHLQTLTLIELDIAHLLSTASTSIHNPTRTSIAEFHASLASISARLQRQVVALRAADIVVGLEPRGGDRVGREVERELWKEGLEAVEVGEREGEGESEGEGEIMRE